MTYITANANDFRQLRVLRNLIEVTGGYVAGGAFKNLLSDEKPKDIDVFFDNESDYLAARNRLLDPEIVVYENDNALCLNFDGQRVELIKSQTGDVQSMLDRFDFTIAKFAMWKDDDQFYVQYHEKFFEHLFQKKLVIDSLPHPLNTFERVLKYSRYGYTLCQGSKQTLVEGIRVSTDETLPRNFYVGID